MQTKEAIEKVLDALGDNPEVAKSMENDVEGTLRTLVGNEVSEQDFANLTKGTGKLFSDKAIAALFLKLLKKKANRSGLVKLLLKVGGVSLLIKLLGKSKKEDDDDSSLLSSDRCGLQGRYDRQRRHDRQRRRHADRCGRSGKRRHLCQRTVYQIISATRPCSREEGAASYRKNQRGLSA